MSRTDLVASFAAVPRRLATLLARGEGPRDGRHSDGWSSREEVLHLLVVESVVWQRRLDDLETMDDPHWSTTEPGLGPEPDPRPIDDLVSAFAAARTATVARVASLDETGWARSGTHARYGLLDVAGLLRLALDHDEEHLAALG